MRKVALRLFIASSTAVLSTVLSLPTAHAQQRDATNEASDELEQKIKNDILQELEPILARDISQQLQQKITEDILRQLPQQLMKVLLQQNLLNRQIERGIDDYVRRQQQAQAMALEKQRELASENAKHVRPVTRGRDHIYGDPSAPISLIEYSDFECPFCKQFSSTPKEIVDSYGGRVNWVYRHFPLEMHNPGAKKEAEASECANNLGENDAFWKYANAIYARTQSNGRGFPLSQLEPLAKEVGLNRKRFRECMDSGRFASRVEEDIEEGRKIGISATPTNILLDSKMGEVILKSGALPSEAFRADIERMLGSGSQAKNAALR
jgi:protein-disulfide isomerase